MSEPPDLFSGAEKEYRELNNELVIPSYHAFLEELNLPFHIWDKLREQGFDPQIAHAEL